jgi:hypothetical protein
MILTVDRSRYVNVARCVASAALAVRAASMPPGWAFTDSATTRVIAGACGNIRALYSILKVFGTVSSAADTVHRRVSIRSIAAVALAEALTNAGLKGFAPYTGHLYVYALALRMGSRGASTSTADALPVLAYFPAVVYFAAGVAKLHHSARSWLMIGDIVDNAIDLYRWNCIGVWVSQLNPIWIARAVLAFELLALPVSLLRPGALQAVSIIGLGFHAGNYVILRISFWHLAVMHIPIVLAVRWQRSHQGMRK